MNADTVYRMWNSGGNTKQRISIEEILKLIDTYINLDDYYLDLKEALKEYIGYEIIE